MVSYAVETGGTVTGIKLKVIRFKGALHHNARGRIGEGNDEEKELCTSENCRERGGSPLLITPNGQ